MHLAYKTRQDLIQCSGSSAKAKTSTNQSYPKLYTVSCGKSTSWPLSSANVRHRSSYSGFHILWFLYLEYATIKASPVYIEENSWTDKLAYEYQCEIVWDIESLGYA